MPLSTVVVTCLCGRCVLSGEVGPLSFVSLLCGVESPMGPRDGVRGRRW